MKNAVARLSGGILVFIDIWAPSGRMNQCLLIKNEGNSKELLSSIVRSCMEKGVKKICAIESSLQLVGTQFKKIRDNELVCVCACIRKTLLKTG